MGTSGRRGDCARAGARREELGGVEGARRRERVCKAWYGGRVEATGRRRPSVRAASRRERSPHLSIRTATRSPVVHSIVSRIRSRLTSCVYVFEKREIGEKRRGSCSRRKEEEGNEDSRRRRGLGTGVTGTWVFCYAWERRSRARCLAYGVRYGGGLEQVFSAGKSMSRLQVVAAKRLSRLS